MGESLEGIKGLGAKRIEALRKAGITTPEQLINYFPSKYIDYTNVKRIADCYMGEDAVLKVCLSGKVSQAHVNGRTLTRAVLCDESGKITATWFRQPWVFKQLNDMEGPFTVYGRVDRHNGKLCLNSPRIVTDLRITAEYKPIEAIPQKTLRELIQSALALIEPSETLPEGMLQQYNLLPRAQALYEIHAPSEKSALERALYRMHFEDMLYFMVNAFGMRQYRKMAFASRVRKVRSKPLRRHCLSRSQTPKSASSVRSRPISARIRPWRGSSRAMWALARPR